MARARIERTPKGDFRLRLPEVERAVLASLPGQLRELLSTEDAALRRLFPPAYPDDDEREEEYRRLVREDLLGEHLESLRILEETVEARRLAEDQMTAWLGALNDLRLVLGTRLDVSEDEPDVEEDDPRAPALALYHYLGWLQTEVIAALAEGLDPRGSAGD